MAVEINTGVSFDIGPALAALDRLGNADASLRTEMIKNREAVNNAFASGSVQNQLALSNAQAAQQADLRATTAAIRSAQDEVKRLTQAQRELEQAQKKTNDPSEVARLAGLYEKNKQKILEAKAAVLESKDAADKERQAIQETIEARRQATNQAKLEAAQVRDVTAATKLEAQAAKEAGAEVAKATEAGKQGGGEAGGGFFGSLVTKVSGAAAGLFAFNEISNRVKRGLEDYGAIKGVQATLTAVAGSATAGAQEFSYIKREADNLGLSLVPTAKAYAGLSAATKEANLSVATTRDVFEGVAGAAKVFDLSADETTGALRALQQIASKGVVSAEELRGQLGEKLPPAMGLAGKSLGLTTTELDKQLRAGKILSSDFLPKFAAQLKATYGDATANAAEQVGANLGRIDTFFSSSSAKVGQAVAPYVAALAQLITPTKTLTEVAQGATDAYFRQADASRNLVATVTPLLARYEQLSGQTTRNTSEQKELDSVIQQLAKSVPGAVTEFDKYGRALGLNGEALRKFLDSERNYTRYGNLEPLKKNRAALLALIKEQDELQKQLNNTVTGDDGLKRRQVAEASSGGTGGGGSFVRILSQAESDKITADYTAKLTLVQQDIDANLEQRQRLRGYNPLLPKVPTTAEVQGLIEKQKQIIKDLQTRQLKATQENQGAGGDFLLGAGGLDVQLDKANKELARLEGKQDKSAIARENKAKAALEAYRREQQTYKELTLKAAEQQATDARAASEKQLQLDLTNIYEASRKLLAAKKKAGQGDTLDDTQLDQQGVQIQGAYKANFDRLLAIARTKRDQLIGLEKEGDQKQLDQLEARFQDELEKYANQADLLQKAKEQHERDLRALNNTQANQHVDEAEGGAMQDAIADAAALGYQDPAVAERKKQEAILEVQLEFAAKRLKIAEDLDAAEGTEKTHTAVKKIQNDIDEFGKHLEGLKKEDRKFDLFKFVFGKNDSPELRKAFEEVASVVASSLSNIFQAQQQAAQQQAAEATQAINELTGRIQIEQALRDSGSASNLAGLRQELAEQREIRKNAQKEQREAAQAQVILDGILQASNLITSISNIFAGSSKLDLLLPGAGTALAIGLSGVLVGAFLPSKVAAYEAAGAIGGGGGYFKGGYTGSSTGDLHEERGVVHAKEFVHTAEKTAKYRELFEALHTDTPSIINWDLPQYRALLPNQLPVILPDLDLPEKLRAEKQASLIINQAANLEPVRAELAAVRTELSDIKASNREMANRLDIIPLATGGYMERDPKTGSTHTKLP